MKFVLRTFPFVGICDRVALRYLYGAAKRSFGDLDGAIACCDLAKKLLDAAGTFHTPAGNILMNSLASCKKAKRDHHGERNKYRKMKERFCLTTV